MSGYKRIKNFYPENVTIGFNQLFTPANVNCVSKVSSPISVFLAPTTPLAKIIEQRAKNKSSELFYAIGEKASLLPNKDSSTHIKQGTKCVANVVKKASKKINFSQAMKRFRFKGKAKFLSVILAAGLVTYSAFATD